MTELIDELIAAATDDFRDPERKRARRLRPSAESVATSAGKKGNPPRHQSR